MNSLWPWAAASLAVHGLLLFFLFDDTTVSVEPSGDRMVTVEMLPVSPPAVSSMTARSTPVVAVQDSPNAFAVRQDEVKPDLKRLSRQLAVSEAAVSQSVQSARASASEAPNTESSDAKNASSEDGRQRVAVRERLEKFKYYPASARRRGIAGDVEVGFRLKADGTAEQVLVLASSGYDILDRAALETVNRAQPFPATGGSYQFRLRFQRL